MSPPEVASVIRGAAGSAATGGIRRHRTLFGAHILASEGVGDATGAATAGTEVQLVPFFACTHAFWLAEGPSEASHHGVAG